MAKIKKFNKPRGINSRKHKLKMAMSTNKDTRQNSSSTSLQSQCNHVNTVSDSETLHDYSSDYSASDNEIHNIHVENESTSECEQVDSNNVPARNIAHPKSYYNITDNSTSTATPNLKLTFKAAEPEADFANTDGYRIMNLESWATHVGEITLHSALCPLAQKVAQESGSALKFVCEKKRYGLASILSVQCMGCWKEFKLWTSPKMQSSDTNRHFEINMRAVWGHMATGGGGRSLNESLVNMGIPGLNAHTFSQIESEISLWWKQILDKEMIQAGAEEREMAIARHDYHEDIPAITVIVDGGWSKRSHKHTYNAAGGTAVIIGAASKKLLYLGVRNKYCDVCLKADTFNKEAPSHTCFQNWSESSQAMEADIILEGYQECESKHGIRYTRFIGDGDSSTYKTLIERGPYWCKELQKLECSNHACKCLRTHLENLVTSHPQHKKVLDKKTRIRLVSGVRCAIKMRSSQDNRSIAKKELKHDILNSVNHIFGFHEHCSADFCKAKLTNKETHTTPISVINEDSQTEEENHDDSDDIEGTLQSQINYWTEGTTEDEEQEAREDNPRGQVPIDPELTDFLSSILDRLASKVDRLIGNFTTNLAENWMSMRTKFDGGKMIFRCKRGSWNSRCYGAGLSQLMGHDWSSKAWEQCTGISPTNAMTKFYSRKEAEHKASLRCKAKQDVKARSHKRKRERSSQSTCKRARLSYGEECIDVSTDVSKDELQQQCDSFYSEKVCVSSVQRTTIEKTSRSQFLSGVWHGERHKRLTTCNFGEIIQRRPATKVTKFVKRLLYTEFRGTSYTRYGIQEENATLLEYEIEKSSNGSAVKVKKAGLHIHPEHSFLAASTDGLVTVGENVVGLLEVKNVLKDKPITLECAAKTVKSFCLELTSNKLSLKKNHKYYFQCQGQLNIFQQPWIDFVVRTLRPYQIHIERIYPDSDLWNNVEQCFPN